MGDMIIVPVGVIDTYEWDQCCAQRLAKALREAVTPMTEWTCPKCGVEYRPRMVGRLRHWEPQCPVVVFRP